MRVVIKILICLPKYSYLVYYVDNLLNIIVIRNIV